MHEGIDRIRETISMDGTRCLCLVDGEHYPSVITWSLRELEKLGAIVSGIIFLGGTEKVKDVTEKC